MRKVRFHIDRLVLDGVGRVDPAAFERALSQKIAQALTNAERTGGLDGVKSSASVDGGRMAKPGDPAALGAHLAERLTGGNRS